MKKSISTFLVVILSIFTFSVQAQIGFGVKGGLNLTKASLNKSSFDSDNFTGFFIGPMAEFTVPLIGIGMDAALLFSQRGTKIEDKTVKQNGLEIPVNLKYTIGFSSLFAVYLAAGPDFMFNFKKEKETRYYDVELNKSYVALNLGAGIKLMHKLQLGVNYNIPFSDSGEIMYTNQGNEITSGFKNRIWQVSLAYMF